MGAEQQEQQGMDAEGFYNAIRYFGEPKIPEGANKDLIQAGYFKALMRYESNVLELAWENMFNSRKHMNFPLLEECIRFCRDAQDEIESRLKRLEIEAAKAEAEAWKKKNGDEPRPSVNPWSEYRIRQADRMMDSDVGRQASKEGWVIALHDFCREQARLPNTGEASHIREDALSRYTKLERKKHELAQGNPKALAATEKLLAGATRAMTTKRERLLKIALRR